MADIRDISSEVIIIVAIVIVVLLLLAAILFANYKISGDAPGSGALIALIGLGAVAFLIIRKH